MCIETRCRTDEQFVTTFGRYVDGDAIFVPTLATRPPKLDTPFVFVLADGSPVLSGTAYVRDSWRTTANPFNVPGILFGIRSLEPDSSELLERMRARCPAMRVSPFVSEPPVIARQYVTLVPRRSSLAESHDNDAHGDEDVFALPTRVDVHAQARAASSADDEPDGSVIECQPSA